MPDEFLQLTQQDGVAVLTIDRQDRRNALHGPLWTALLRMAQQLEEQAPRALVITGAGGHFCSGMDLRADNPLVERMTPAVVAQDRTRCADLIRELKASLAAIARLPCPVIAAVEGACAGGGMELALACDLRVAAKDAHFSLPETRVGMVPDLGGIVRLTRLVGPSRATDIVLTCRKIAADEALELGIVNRVTDPGQALAASIRLAKQFELAAPKATVQALLTLRQVASLPDEKAFDVETAAGAQALCSGEAVEGLAAFAEKRPPRWA